MNVQCPSCGNEVAVAAEHLGMDVQCPHCEKAMRIPAAVSSAGPTKQCPHCNQTILKVARRCKFCKAEIQPGMDEESATERLTAKESLVAKLSADPRPTPPYEVTGWFQWSTITCAGLTVLSIAAAAIGFSGSDRSPLFFAGPVGMVLSIFLAVIAMILGVRDLLAPKFFYRRTPVKGAKAFLVGLCAKRYAFAYYCLLDADKDNSLRRRPALPVFEVDADSHSFDTFEGFRDYWKNLLHTKGTQARIRKVRLVRAEGDFAEVSAELKLERQSTSGFLLLGVLGALLFAQRDAIKVKKLFRRIDDQWYAVNGELDSGEDRFGFGLLAGRGQGG